MSHLHLYNSISPVYILIKLWKTYLLISGLHSLGFNQFIILFEVVYGFRAMKLALLQTRDGGRSVRVIGSFPCHAKSGFFISIYTGLSILHANQY